MTIAFDTPTSAAVAPATSCSFSHTVGAGSNRALWVIANCWNSSDLLAGGSASFGGTSLGSPLFTITTVPNCTTYVWQKAAPASGAGTVLVTPSASAYFDVWAISASGVDQALLAALANKVQSASQFATSPLSQSVTTPAGGACISFCAYRNTAASTLAPVSGNGFTAVGSPPAGSYAHTALATAQAPTAHGWSWTGGSAGADTEVIFALPINAAATAAGPTISAQPSNATVTAPATANFTVTRTASGGGTLSDQWQRSTDGGATWNNVTTGTGGTTTSFTTAATTVSAGNWNNGDQVRVLCTETGGTNPGTTTSSAATLTVNAGGGGARLFRQHVGGQLTGIGSTGPFFNNPLN